MAEGPRDTTSDDGVLAGLPATRPNRLGGRARRGETPTARRKPPAAAKPKAAAPKRKATAASTKASALKPKAAAAAKAKVKPPTAARARARAEAKAAEVPPPKPTPIADGRKPRPVRAGHPRLDDAAKQRPERAPQPDGRGPSLVGGVAQAAGDVATVGIKLGGRLVKGVAKKLPRP